VADRRDELDGDEEERREYQRQAAEAARSANFAYFPLSWEEHHRRELENRRLELDIREREARLASPKAEPSGEPEVEWRGPYRHDLLEKAVRLREQGTSHTDISKALSGLSKRQAGYISHAVDAGKVWTTRTGLGGLTRSDKLGAYIPKV
jgi:hypothetical protein